jgi:hypothetical protein
MEEPRKHENYWIGFISQLRNKLLLIYAGFALSQQAQNNFTRKLYRILIDNLQNSAVSWSTHGRTKETRELLDWIYQSIKK